MTKGRIIKGMITAMTIAYVGIVLVPLVPLSTSASSSSFPVI